MITLNGGHKKSPGGKRLQKCWNPFPSRRFPTFPGIKQPVPGRAPFAAPRSLSSVAAPLLSPGHGEPLYAGGVAPRAAAGGSVALGRAQGTIGERTGPDVKLGERGASKGIPPGTACSISRKEWFPRGGRLSNIFGEEGLPTFSEAFPSPDFFRVPCLGFRLDGRRFFPGMEHYHPYREFFFVSPGILVQRS